MLAVAVKGPEPSGLVFEELKDPVPNPHQVLIEVRATALNRADLLQRRGLYPPPAGESEVLGLECAGIISSVGADVHEFKAGDRVMALLPGGGYAERVAVHERLVIPLPDALSFEEGAAIPEAFITAQQALLDAGALNPGERVLIHACASGVGSAAAQIARELGSYTFGTVRSEAKRAFITTLGIERAIDTTQEDFAQVIRDETRKNGVDVIVDCVGAALAEKNHAVLAIGGRWVVVGLLGGSRIELDLARLLGRRQTLTGIVLRSRPLPEKAALIRAFRRELLPWFSEGRLKAVIDRVIPWTEVVAAHERMEANQNIGKIVLRVS